MRPGQNKRMRGRNNNNRRGPNPLTRSFESNGPDVKVRGTAQHIAEKYTQLARDAHVSGDPVAAESYLQHAEHYYRIIAAAHQAQQALQNGTADERDDDDDDFDTANDRFTFRAPQSAQQQQQSGQPFIGDRVPGEFVEGAEPAVEGGEEQPGQDRGQERVYEPREPRQQGRHHRDDRRGGRGSDRNNDRNQDRGFRPRGENGERPQGERSERFGGERGERNDRFNAQRPRRFQPEVEGMGEQPALPAFLTAPVRPVHADAPPAEAPEVVAEGGEDARGGPFRARRRRRPRAGAEEGSFEPATEAAGGDES